eukprot:4959940-Pyramimonas_sp.AAC.1
MQRGCLDRCDELQMAHSALAAVISQQTSTARARSGARREQRWTAQRARSVSPEEIEPRPPVMGAAPPPEQKNGWRPVPGARPESAWGGVQPARWGGNSGRGGMGFRWQWFFLLSWGSGV